MGVMKGDTRRLDCSSVDAAVSFPEGPTSPNNEIFTQRP